MQTATFYGWAHLAVAALYLLVAYRCWAALRAGRGARPAPADIALLLLAILGHGALLAQDVFGRGGLWFGFAQGLSAIFFGACALLWIEGFFVALGGLYALFTPLAALGLLLPLAFHGYALVDAGASLALRVHLAVSILAYVLFTIAVLHGVLMIAVDRHLRRPARGPGHSIVPLLSQMPPLLALESLLFRQLAGGFVLLTASLASGMAFSEELFGRPMRFNHMTLFGVISWSVFGALLVGRYAFGWRGKVAQRWLFVGFLMLFLAYIGTRFVSEVLLGRTAV